MLFNKVTTGFVLQIFNEKGECQGQNFFAGDECEYEKVDGTPIDPPVDAYFPFEMKQPKDLKEEV